MICRLLWAAFPPSSRTKQVRALRCKQATRGRRGGREEGEERGQRRKGGREEEKEEGWKEG